MERDTLIAIIHTGHPELAEAIGSLSTTEQNAIFENGGDVVLKSGKSPNGKAVTLIAVMLPAGKVIAYAAIGESGEKQNIGVKQVATVMSKIS